MKKKHFKLTAGGGGIDPRLKFNNKKLDIDIWLYNGYQNYYWYNHRKENSEADSIRWTKEYVTFLYNKKAPNLKQTVVFFLVYKLTGGKHDI